MAMKYGFKVYFIDPVYTIKIGEKLGKELGLDKRSASAYALLIFACKLHIPILEELYVY